MSSPSNKQSAPHRPGRPLAVLGAYGPAIMRCGYLEAHGAQDIEIHRPNSYRMIGVRDGTAKLHIGPDVLSFTPGEVMLLRPGGEYRIELAPHAQLIRLVFDVVHQPRQGHLGEITHTRPAARQPLPLEVWGVDLPLRIPRESAARCMMVLELIRSEHWQRPAVYARACGRLGLLLGELSADASEPKERSPAGQGYWAHRVERLLHKQISSLPTTGQVAAALGVSREHLSRSYRKETQLPLSLRLKQECWRRACDLLANTTTPIQTIAKRVGYRQGESFAQAFRAARGLTPTAFRRSAREYV